ncbi:MAG: S16 family serine protease [Candidatus Bathyarchaeia archaeon]
MEENAHKSYIRKLLLLSLVGNILLVFLTGFVVLQNNGLQSQISDLAGSYRTLEQQLNLTSNQLNYYKQQAEYYSSLATSGNATTGLIGQTTIHVVAVRTIQKGFQVEHEGVVMTAEVELREGSGRILVDTVPKIGIDIQTSLRTGVLVAENITGTSFGKTDVILTIRASEDVEIVDGPSAGAAITVALIASVWKQSLNETVYMTGTINSDKSVGQVGGIPEKALAAAANGSKYFLVPKGQSTIVIYEPKITHPFPGWTIITYERKTINLQDYLEENGYSTVVKEVESVEEAYEKFIAQR